MKNRRVLYVSSEVIPYLPESEISTISFEAPKMVSSKGGQIRIFTPRFGNINERRHQLHEVIRLSGMNLVVNDIDMPLIIKVASIPRQRIQVYFIDNEDYFKRKATVFDKNGKLFKDNDERAIFFTKGVIEAVKKQNWAPDIIHVHGWMASLFPIYLKNFYQDEPLFQDSKIVLSLYDQSFEGSLNSQMHKKLKLDSIPSNIIDKLKSPTYINLMTAAIDDADALIVGSENIPDELDQAAKSAKVPLLAYQNQNEFAEAYYNFYKQLISE